MSPGIRYLPAPSTTRAPGGIATSLDGPSEAMRSPRRMTVALSIAGAPVIEMTVTSRIATGAPAGGSCDDVATTGAPF